MDKTIPAVVLGAAAGALAGVSLVLWQTKRPAKKPARSMRRASDWMKGRSSREPLSSSIGIELPITVTIPKIEVESGTFGQKHSVYVTQVTAFGLTNLSRHTFEDFETLHAQISGKVRYQLPALPRSYWWGNEETQTVQERRGRLEILLQQLCEQPEILSDGEEQLMRFLNMPKAAAAAIRFVLHTSQQWLQRLYEATAESEGLRALKDAQLEAALLMVLQAESIWESKRLACELLARRYRAGVETESTSSSIRSSQVKVLLSLLTDEEIPEERSDEVKLSARKAVLTMACDGRATWMEVLQEFLEEEGLSQLLDLSTQAGEGQRLVVELLLRGFEGPVVQKFAEPKLVNDRKRLLNELFLSSDAFVRGSVGVLLAALLTDAEGYREAAQAEAGLAALREEMLRPPASLTVDLQRLLTEEESWRFLLRLAQCHSSGQASNFVLLMMLALASGPQTLLETPGLHELLVHRLTDRQDSQLRGLAAKRLLELYRVELPPGAAESDLLGRAVASSAMEALMLHEAELQELTAGANEALERHHLVSRLEACLSSGIQSIEALRAQANLWSSCLARAQSETQEAHVAQGQVQEDLATFARRLEDACSELREEGTTGGTASEESLAQRFSQEELLATCGPGDVARAQADLDQLMQARRDLGVQLSEQQEQLQLVTFEMETAKASLAKDTSYAVRVAECQSQREALLQEVAVGQEKANMLDLQMRETCEALSVYKAELEAKRAAPAKPLTKSMQAWAAVTEAQEVCERQVSSALSSLQVAGESLKEEARCRGSLSWRVRELAEKLMALDEELELLQQQAGVEEEDPEIT